MAEHQGKKLRSYIDRKRINKTELLKRLSFSRGTLYLLFEKDVIDPDYIEELQGQGIDFLDERIDGVPEKTENRQEPNIIYVPLVAYGGFLHGYASKQFDHSLERFSMPGIRGEHFAFEVQGNSMEPHARAGDVVIAKKEERLEWMVKGRAYVLQTVDGMVIKIFDKIDDKKAYFKSSNKDGGNPEFNLKDIKGVYLVVKVIKDFMAAY